MKILLRQVKRQGLLLLIAASLLTAGCMQQADIGQQHRAASEAGSQARDELIAAVGAEPEEGFDPIQGWGRYGSPLFQSTLLKRDSNLNIVFDLALSYSIHPDGMTWTVKLREDAKFSDGEPVTSEDVKFTFEQAAASGAAIDLTNLNHIEAPDPHTVIFTLKTAQSTFIHHLVSTGIVPEHAYSGDYASKPVGSGPFKLVQWNKGQQVIIERNELYYGEKPAFRQITFLFLNEDAAYAAAKAGQADIVSIPASFSRNIPQGMKLASVQSVDNRGIMFPYVPAGGMTEQGYPIGNDVTSDPAIRKAINLAVDRAKLVEGILEGHGTPAYTSADGMPWGNPASKVKDGDLTKAKELLAAAGWQDADQDGIAEKDGLKAKFTLIYPASDVIRQSLAVAAADMVKPLGIQMDAAGKSWDEISKLMYSNAVLFGWGSHDPLEMHHLYSSKYAGDDLFNPGYYKNDTVDRYLERAMTSSNEDEANEWRRKAWWDGQTGMSTAGDAPWAWLVNLNHLYLVKEGLSIGRQKVHPHGHGWPVTDNIEEWAWIQ